MPKICVSPQTANVTRHDGLREDAGGRRVQTPHGDRAGQQRSDGGGDDLEPACLAAGPDLELGCNQQAAGQDAVER